MCLIVASVTMLLITLLDDNEAKPPIMVAYLRKPHICNIINIIIIIIVIIFPLGTQLEYRAPFGVSAITLQLDIW
jgi:hypothetical protein